MKGKQIKALRKRLRLTQTQFAELVGVASNTVARWERDELGMRPAMVLWIRSLGKAAPSRKP